MYYTNKWQCYLIILNSILYQVLVGVTFTWNMPTRLEIIDYNIKFKFI